MAVEHEHHPMLMDASDRGELPEFTWHHLIGERYPIGSTAELLRRSQGFFYRWLARRNGNDHVLEANPMQPDSKLLESLASVAAVDVIAPTFLIKQGNFTKTVLLMEDHVHSSETRFTMGKTTIVQRLLKLALVDWQVRSYLHLRRGEKLSADDLLKKLLQTKSENASSIEVPKLSSTPNITLLAGDVTFIGRSHDDKLVAMATVGTKEDFLFDIARSGIRRLIADYNRVDPNIMAAQAEITTRLDLTNSIWADTSKTYPIDEIIFLTPQRNLMNRARWVTSPKNSDAAVDIRLQLQNNPLYIADEIDYWKIDAECHRKQVDAIISNIRHIPKVRYLGINDPKSGYTLRDAANLLKKEFFTNTHNA
jgi:hypothetical protein